MSAHVSSDAAGQSVTADAVQTPFESVLRECGVIDKYTFTIPEGICGHDRVAVWDTGRKNFSKFSALPWNSAGKVPVILCPSENTCVGADPGEADLYPLPPHKKLLFCGPASKGHAGSLKYEHGLRLAVHTKFCKSDNCRMLGCNDSWSQTFYGVVSIDQVAAYEQKWKVQRRSVTTKCDLKSFRVSGPNIKKLKKQAAGITIEGNDEDIRDKNRDDHGAFLIPEGVSAGDRVVFCNMRTGDAFRYKSGAEVSIVMPTYAVSGMRLGAYRDLCGAVSRAAGTGMYGSVGYGLRIEDADGPKCGGDKDYQHAVRLAVHENKCRTVRGSCKVLGCKHAHYISFYSPPEELVTYAKQQVHHSKWVNSKDAARGLKRTHIATLEARKRLRECGESEL